MKLSVYRRCAGLGVVLLLASPMYVRAREASGRFERSLKVSGAVSLDVQTGGGRITVRAGDAGTVRVVGSIKVKSSFWSSGSPEEKVRALESNPPIEQSGNSIRVGHIRDDELRKDVFIDYDIVVPADSSLEAKTGLGDVLADNLRGSVRADTGAGSIRLTGLAGEVHANTGLGDVEIRGARGRVRADSGAGSIRVEGEPTAAWRLNTGLGDVRVRITGQSGFELVAHTGLGSVHSSLPLTVQGSFGNSEVRGKVRGGGPLVDINSGAGSIHID